MRKLECLVRILTRWRSTPSVARRIVGQIFGLVARPDAFAQLAQRRRCRFHLRNLCARRLAQLTDLTRSLPAIAHRPIQYLADAAVERVARVRHELRQSLRE